MFWSDPSGADAIEIGANFHFSGDDAKKFFEEYLDRLDQNESTEETVSNMYEMEATLDGNDGGGDGNDGGRGTPIKKYVSSLDGTKINYLLAENVGIAGSFQIKGGLVVDVYGEMTKLSIGIVGRTLAKNVGKIN